MRHTKFVDLPVYKETREYIKNKKGKNKSYDEFLREILQMELGL